jgi:natural product precursor
MKKTETKKPLPKLRARTLDHQDLTRVTGGCTCGTTSSCHIDGTNDGDQQK